MSLEKNVYKVILFGNSNVGKSTLLKRLVSDDFDPKTKKTIGVEFKSRLFYVDNLAVTLQIWDFSGERRFYFLFELYTRGVAGGIFMFDMTDVESLLSLNEWVGRVRQYAPNHFPIFFIGGKTDLVPNNRDLGKVEDDAPLDEKAFFMCSAKTGQNVQDAFEIIARQIYHQQNELKGIRFR